MTAGIDFILSLTGQFWPVLVGVVAVLVALLTGRSAGRDAERRKQAEAKDKLQEHYDAIDREPVDPGAAYDRLRGMSDDKRRR